jgi:putative integral membrane protein (TIGR02587 family)
MNLRMEVAMQDRPGPWEKELDDLARAFSGAFLLGVPLLFTMEMWWIGEYASLWKLLLFLALAFGVNVMLAYFAGFKEETTLGANLAQAVEALAVGAVASTVVLVVLNRIEPGHPLDAILGKIILQTVPLSIGASAANALLARRENRPTDDQQDEGRERDPMRATLADLGATVAGGIFIGFTIAPTEEVPMLAASLGYGNTLALIALTLFMTYIIVFESDFSPKQHGEDHGPFQHPVTETALSYAVSLVLALVALFLFDQVRWGDNTFTVVTEMLVLGLPTAVGGAAGRVLL